jgi:hypothetical protein
MYPPTFEIRLFLIFCHLSQRSIFKSIAAFRVHIHQQSIHSFIRSFIDIGAAEITHRHPHQPQTIAKMPGADVVAAIWDNKKRSVRRRLFYIIVVTGFIFADKLKGLLLRLLLMLLGLFCVIVSTITYALIGLLSNATDEPTTTKEAVDFAGQPLAAQDLGDTIIVAENADVTKAGDDSDGSQAESTTKRVTSIEDVSVSFAVCLFTTTSIFL